ncbi:MAG TPA: HIT domain-containing protein [Candidatus Ozemobacteraceae bacterium]|nr:HIT domain-containing protein [Candidatus Ozemobacteraceae bacterium]
MAFRRHIFVPNKRDYIRGRRRPTVECILCSILKGDPQVESLLVWHDENFAVSVNLYPYNAGHLLVFPARHVFDLRELHPHEVLGMFELTRHFLKLLDHVYEPAGYNIGCNMGDASGASIEHFHQHIVPRYPKELGFVDIVAGAKILIEDPQVTMEKLRHAVREDPVRLPPIPENQP